MLSSNIIANEYLLDEAKEKQQNNMEIDLGCLMDALSYVDHAPDERKTTEQPEKDCKRKSLEFLSGGHDACGELEEHATLYCPKRSSVVSAITLFSMESLDFEDSFISRNNSIDTIEEGSAMILSTAFSTQKMGNTSGVSSAPRRPNRRGSMEMGSGLLHQCQSHQQCPSGGLRRPNRRGSIETGGSGSSDIPVGLCKPGRRGSMESGCRGSVGSGRISRRCQSGNEKLVGGPRKPGRRGSIETQTTTSSIELRKPLRKGSMNTGISSDYRYNCDMPHGCSEISDLPHDMHSISEATEYACPHEIKYVSSPIHPITELTEYEYTEKAIGRESYFSDHAVEISELEAQQSEVEIKSSIVDVRAFEVPAQLLYTMKNPCLPPRRQLLPPPKQLPCNAPRVTSRECTN